METNWAASHLETIRTLMERSAVYRRALAPIMIGIGFLGISAGVMGAVCEFSSDRAFIACWLGVGLVGIAFALWQARRQALKESEPFLTPPVRRIIAAVAPAWAVGAFFAIFFLIGGQGNFAPTVLPPLWMVLYGISLHAAGFFAPRGIKLLGWLYVLLGCTFFAVAPKILLWELSDDWRTLIHGGHLVMGLFFGGLHLAYGIYLNFTEKRKNAA